ncbi:hypothetical protein F2P81_018491 [Scophthalmus maximus]|uniref:Uncharacterized protein n=1 Tax=Scophthalmus maximus TaxID=52904 RepID=A0A6A4S2E7_SCOMX|nr:hypothetical protein F2P81_018491 [Scophthalmus maximus]
MVLCRGPNSVENIDVRSTGPTCKLPLIAKSKRHGLVTVLRQLKEKTHQADELVNKSSKSNDQSSLVLPSITPLKSPYWQVSIICSLAAVLIADHVSITAFLRCPHVNTAQRKSGVAAPSIDKACLGARIALSLTEPWGPDTCTALRCDNEKQEEAKMTVKAKGQTYEDWKTHRITFSSYIIRKVSVYTIHIYSVYVLYVHTSIASNMPMERNANALYGNLPFSAPLRTTSTSLLSSTLGRQVLIDIPLVNTDIGQNH